MPEDATSWPPIADDRFTVRGRSWEGQTVALSPIVDESAEPTDETRSRDHPIARSLNRLEHYWSHRGHPLLVLDVRATILDNLQSPRYVSLPIDSSGPHTTMAGVIHRTSLSTGLCPPGDISLHSRALSATCCDLDHKSTVSRHFCPRICVANRAPLSTVHPQVVDCSVDSSGTDCRDRHAHAPRVGTQTLRSATRNGANGLDERGHGELVTRQSD
jgi:hypothetical protein